MSRSEIQVLSLAHQLFDGGRLQPALNARAGDYTSSSRRLSDVNLGAGQRGYESATGRVSKVLSAAARTDEAAEAAVAAAHHDHARTRELTRRVLDEARADSAATPLIPLAPLAEREAMRRRALRLRMQHAHVLAARGSARRHALALRALRYRMLHHRGAGSLRIPAGTGRAEIAVRAALSRLGRPYVWGATGPDQFDCSGLVQWSYAQAGVHLGRTTYQQIDDGIPIERSQVRPGDLVFPHPGHVQLAIGRNLVIEAPNSGALVRISPMGTNVQIRRATVRG